jgi:uncharacterized protein with HEPN domain
MPRPEDLDRLRHTIDSAREAMSFLKGKSRQHLTSDRKLQLALIHLLAIVGEAAGRLSARAQATAPDVP